MTNEYFLNISYTEKPLLCLWKIAINHAEDFDKIKGIENCINCDGHDLLCDNYLDSRVVRDK